MEVATRRSLETAIVIDEDDVRDDKEIAGHGVGAGAGAGAGAEEVVVGDEDDNDGPYGVAAHRYVLRAVIRHAGTTAISGSRHLLS